MFGLVTGGTTRFPYLMTSALPRSPTAPVAAHLPAQMYSPRVLSIMHLHAQTNIVKGRGPRFTIDTTKAALEKMHHHSNVGKKCIVTLLGLCPMECLQ